MSVSQELYAALLEKTASCRKLRQKAASPPLARTIGKPQFTWENLLPASLKGQPHWWVSLWTLKMEIQNSHYRTKTSSNEADTRAARCSFYYTGTNLEFLFHYSSGDQTIHNSTTTRWEVLFGTQILQISANYPATASASNWIATDLSLWATMY